MRRLRKDLPNAAGCTESIVTYSVRHSLATIAAAAGIRDRVLADIMGHTDTRTTARYLHLQVEHLRRAMEILELSQRPKGKPEPDQAAQIGQLQAQIGQLIAMLEQKQQTPEQPNEEPMAKAA